MQLRAPRTLVLPAVASAALLLGLAPSASAGTLDQQQSAFNEDAGVFSTQSDAQTFTAGITGDLDEADLVLSTVGDPPPTLNVEIRTTAMGKPTATVLASASVDTAGLPEEDEEAFVPIAFATPAPVMAGRQYAIVVYSPGSAGNAVGWFTQGTGDPYAGGEVFISGDPLPPGSNWAGFSFEDFAFKTFVVPAPPAPPAPPSPPQSPPGPSPMPSSAMSGQRAAALKRCKARARKHHWSKARLRSCRKSARRLPV